MVKSCWAIVSSAEKGCILNKGCKFTSVETPRFVDSGVVEEGEGRGKRVGVAQN